MLYSIEIKDLWKIDINNITDYIFRFSFSINIAKKVYDEIYSAIFSLKLFPLRYPIYESDIRVMTIRGKYRVFYRVYDNKKLVIIYRIFASEQNYDDYSF